MISAFLSRKTGSEHPVPQINGTPEQQEGLTELHNQFNVSTENLRIIVKQFMEDMQKGLDQEGATGNKSGSICKHGKSVEEMKGQSFFVASFFVIWWKFYI